MADVENRTRFWFGKYKGKSLDEIPRPYLEWCLENRAGGGEMVEAIASFMEVPIPRKRVKYEGQTITQEELDDLSKKPGFTTVNKFVDGTDVMGVANCSAMFNPLEAAKLEPWNGIDPPFDVEECEIDQEFKELFR